jgi:hypothetical protein
MKKLVALFLLIGAPFARPDSCVTPSTIGFASDNGDIALRIEYGWPEELGPPPREMGMPKQCVATIAKWDGRERGYRFVRSLVLRNRIGPETAVITNDGRFLVTFDEFCESGMSENDLVIYDLEKDITVACSIEDFLPKAYLESLHRSVSNINWRDGHPYLNDDGPYVRIYPGQDSRRKFFCCGRSHELFHQARSSAAPIDLDRIFFAQPIRRVYTLITTRPTMRLSEPERPRGRSSCSR